MSTVKFAPRGEHEFEIEVLLRRIISAAEEAEGFLARYVEVWGEPADPKTREVMEKGLCDGERYFIQVIKGLRDDAAVLRKRAANDPQLCDLAWMLLPVVSLPTANIGRLRKVLNKTVRVTKEYLATRSHTERLG